MTESIPTCPHCGAPLTTTRFAATVACSFCEATVRVDPTVVSASRYHEAWEEWNVPSPAGVAARFSIGDTHWIGERLLAHGEISEVYRARRARWPTELVLLKVLREADDAPLLEQEWSALGHLRRSSAAEGLDLARRIPFPVTSGSLAGATDVGFACAYRWAPGFVHTFESVRGAYPSGIPPVASIWVWRRILEIASIIGRAGLAHGAILPNHLLVEEGEHGVRLVGFSCAAKLGSPLRVVCTQFEDLYPAALLDGGKLTAQADIAMSARCVAYLLGGRGRECEVPDQVPARLANLLRRVGGDSERPEADAWSLREELGEVGTELFGPPAFHPIVLK